MQKEIDKTSYDIKELKEEYKTLKNILMSLNGIKTLSNNGLTIYFCEECNKFNTHLFIPQCNTCNKTICLKCKFNNMCKECKK